MERIKGFFQHISLYIANVVNFALVHIAIGKIIQQVVVRVYVELLSKHLGTFRTHSVQEFYVGLSKSLHSSEYSRR